MRINILLCTAISLLFINTLYAANPASAQPVRTEAIHSGGQLITQKDWSFIENKGQITGTSINGRYDGRAIKYYGHSQGDPFGQGGANLYCLPGAISFVFTKTEKEPSQVSEATGMPVGQPLHSPKGIPSDKITTNRADLVLVNSNPNAQIVASDQQAFYENFYTSRNADHGITNVHAYKTVTYKNIYPHIDMVLHAIKKGVKYEFVVYPGGDANDIQIQWNGLKNLQITENGGISYAMSLGAMKESKPICYQGNNVVPSAFVKNGSSSIGFKLNSYDKSQTLVIDPTLLWATYFGGSDVDHSNGVATDGSGDVFITGYTASTSGIATSGAYQTSNSATDAFLAKFNAAGVEQWATYYGGGTEISASVATDNSGNAYITGNTASSSGIATSGAYQTSIGGGTDAFLAKFNGSGALQWGTYFGGGNGDVAYSVATDGSANVFITGKTASSSRIASSGGYQTALGGSTDAFLAEFNSSGAAQWSTYFGGASSDIGYGVATEISTGDVYITGTTTSSSGIASAGAYQTGSTGSVDAFIAKFDGSGGEQWGTYFGGNSDDESQGITVDGFGNVLIAGYTGSSSGISTSGAYQTNNRGGGYDAFLAEFSSSGSRKWGSYFGGIGSDNINGITSDGSNNVYVTGTTSSASGIATTGAYQSSYNGNNDAFLAKFRNDGALQAATYYGGGDDDEGEAVAVYNGVNVFITGYTASTSGIATSGAYLTSNAGGASDAFLAKFNFMSSNDAGIASILAPTGSFCPGVLGIKVKLKNYGLDPLKKVSINWSVNKNVKTAYSWTGTLDPDSTTTVTIGNYSFQPGIDIVQAWTSLPNGAKDSTIGNDSAMVVDTGNALPSASVVPSTAVCSGSPISIGSTNTSGDSYTWVSNPAGFTSTSSNPSVKPATTTIYTLTEKILATGCINTHTDTISVPSAIVVPDGAICAGFSDSIGGPTFKGDSYSWTSSPAGFTSTSSNPSVSPKVTTTYYLKDTIAAGCKKTASVTITVNPLPTASVIPSTSICSGSISIGGSTVSGNTYSWTSLPSGFTSTLANPSVSPSATTIYTLTEEITATGCTNTHADTISLPSAPVASDTAICGGAFVSIGQPPYKGEYYSWTSLPKGFTSTLSNPSVSPAVTTTYYLKDSATAGCKKTDSVTVTLYPLPSATIAPSTIICPGSYISLGAHRVATDNYVWSSIPAGYSSASSNPYESPLATISYIVTETDTVTGCSNTNSDTITVVAANVIKDTAICAGVPIHIGGDSTPGGVYQWTSNPGGFYSTSANPVVSPTQTTTYHISDTSSVGCTIRNTTMVLIKATPSATVIPSTAICADSISIGAGSVSGDGYSWTSSPAGFTSISSDPKVAPTTTTVYFLTETDSVSGCSRTNTDTISFPSTSKVISDTLICSGNPIFIGGPSYSGNNYSWTSSPSGFTSSLANPSVIPMVTTTYYFKDTIAAGCGKKDSVKVTVIPSPLAKTISNRAICAGTVLSIGAKGVSGNTYSWVSKPAGFTSTLSNPYVHPTVTTTYYLTESVPSTGCSKTDTVALTVNPGPVASVAPATSVCPGTLVSLGGASVKGNYYSWTSSSNGFTSTMANPTDTPYVGTVYTLIVENVATGCSNTDSVTVSMKHQVAGKIINDTTICANSQVSIGAKAVSGSDYSWTSSPSGYTSTLSNPKVSPLANTTYYLTESNPAACNKTDSVKIKVSTIPLAKVIPDTTVCATYQISLGATADTGNTYTWTSNPSGYSSTSSNPIASPAVSTTYYLTETNGTGCSKTDTVLVNANPLPVAKVIPDTVLCAGSSVYIGAASVAGDTYMWTSMPSGFTADSSDTMVSPTVTTKYYLTETITATGCSKTDSVTVSLPNAKVIHDTTICQGASLPIGADSIPGTTYTWTSAPSGFASTLANPTVSPTVTTTYYLKGNIKGLSCSKADSVVITVNPVPAAKVIPDTVLCGGTPVRIGAASVTGDTYLWTSKPKGFVSISADTAVSPTVTTKYYLTETVKATGCSKTDSVTISLPDAKVIHDTTVCQGASVAIGADSIPGTSYAWTSAPSGFTSTLANPTASPTVTTKYYLKGTIKALSCSKTDSLTITVNPLPAAKTIANTGICAGSKLAIGATLVAGDKYAWKSSPSGFTSTSANPSDSPMVSTTYYLTETNTKGCSKTDTVSIAVNPLPSGGIIGDTSICSGGSVSLGATAVSGETYAWTSNPTGFTSTKADPSVSPTATIIYILTEKITSTGCTKTDSSTVSLPVAKLVKDTTLCGGTPLHIGGASFSGHIYSWTSTPSGFTSTSSNPTVAPDTTTTYYLKDSAILGCSKTNSVTVTINPAPTGTVHADTAICSGSIAIGTTAVTGYSYSWASSPYGFSSASSNPTASPIKTTSYYLTIRDANTGCTKVDTVTLTLPVATVISDASICIGSSISIGGTAYAKHTYSWTSSPSGFTSTLADPTVSPTATTTYSLKDTISGCNKLNKVKITVNPLPAAKLVTGITNCSGSPVSIGATAVSGDSYSWTSIPPGFTSTSANPTVSPTLSTVYFLTETVNATGCQKTDSDTVSLPTAPVRTDTTICAGIPISIGKNFSASPGNLYYWTSSPAGFTSTTINPTVNPMVTTTYYFKDSIISKCSKIGTVTITVNPSPSASVVPGTALCSGSISIGGASVSGDKYSWKSAPTGFTSTSANPTVSPTVTTVYTLTETNPTTGCFKINSDTISVPASITILPNSTVCSGAPTAIGGVSYAGNSYSWTSSPAGFTSTLADPIVSPTVKTTYYFKDTIAAGCTKIGSVTLSIIPAPSAKTAANGTVCAGASISIGAAAVSGSKYSWKSTPAGFTSTASNPSANPTVNTTYYLTETLVATGCSKTDSVIVTTNPLPTASTIANSAICSEDYIALGANTVRGNKYSWTSIPTGFNSNLANPIVSPTVKTIFRLTDTVTATGCSKTDSVTIAVNPLPAASIISNTTICFGVPISLGAKAVKGDKYIWTSVPAGFTSTVANPSVSPAVKTTYYLTETISATGCHKSDSVTISVNPLPTAPVIGNKTVCSGTIVYLGDTPVSGDTYSWASVPAGFSSDTSDARDSVIAQTTYKLTETITATGCQKTDSVTIDVNPLPADSTGAAVTVCGGTIVSLGATPVAGDKYSWTSSPSGFTSTLANPTTNSLITTTYYLSDTITSTGCGKTDSVQITELPLPAAYVGHDLTVCAGSSAPLGTTSVADNLYSWTSSPAGFVSTFSGPTAYPKVTTIYILYDSLTSDGCSKTDSVTITMKPIPAASVIHGSSICSGAPIAIGDTSVTNSKYSWMSDPAGFSSDTSDPTVNPIVDTKYYMTETDTLTGCSKTDSVAISINPLPVSSVISDTTDCSGAPILIGGSNVTGNKYFWTSSPGGFSSTIANPTPGPTVATKYKLTEIVSATGCIDSDSVSISILPIPVALVGSNKDICPGSSANIGDVAVSGNSYSWTSTPAGFTSTSSSTTVSPYVTTIYTLTETIMATGCNKSNSVTVTVVPYPAAAVVRNSAICTNASIALGADPVTNHSYSWSSSPAGFSSTSSNPTVSPTAATIYTLTETNDLAGCVKSNSVSITVKPTPAARVIRDTSICSGSSIAIGAVADTGSEYLWSSSISDFSSLASNPIVKPSVSTTYTLLETYNATGCKNTHSVIVNVNPVPVAKVASDVSICPGTPIQIGAAAVGGDSYSWTSYPAGFTSTSADPSVTPTVTTIYTLTETIAATGCNNYNNVTLKIIPAPAAYAGKNETVCDGTSVSLGTTAVNGDSYSWTSDPSGFTSAIANPIVYPTVNTIYILQETNPVGCNKTDSVTINTNPLPDAHWSAIVDNLGNASFSADSIKNKSYLWSFGNNYTATSASTSTTYIKDGKYTVMLTTENGNGCENSFDSTIMIHIHTAGIAGDSAQSFEISLYPNPFSSATTLQYSLIKATRVTVALFDITGKQIGIIEDNNQVAGQYSVQIDAEKYRLTPGVYLLKFMTEDGFVSRQIIKL